MADRSPDTHITADARRPEIMAGYLVVPVDGCTCDGGGEFPHRPECGYEPAIPIAEVEAALARDGRMVVELPTLDADGDCLIGEELDAGAVGVINVDAGAYEVGLYLDGVGFGLKPDRARRIAAAILAAVARGDERVAPDRLAGSVSPKGDNTNGE